MKTTAKWAAALLGAATAAIITTSASAYVVCNGEGECWHTHHHYNYGPGIVVHPNGWAWGPNDHYRWHEHSGRGYWRGGVWITL